MSSPVDNGAKDAIERFSAYFVRSFLKEAKVGEALGGQGGATGHFSDMFQNALAEQMAKGGEMGLTAALERELGPQLGGHEAADAISAMRALEGYGRPDPRLNHAPVAGRISSHFGHRHDPLGEGHRHHAGLDIAAERGTPVVGAGAGTVVRAEAAGDYGNLVVVDHGGGLETRYAHLDSIDVRVGDHIDAGQRLGGVGDTGRSTGPHLHFEVRRHGRAENPLRVVSGLNVGPDRSSGRDGGIP